MPDLSDCQTVPLDKASALHPGFYAGADWLAYEQEKIFSTSWSLVGHADKLAAPGDHIVADVAGKPIIVTRAGDGEVRAFYNICRHRAGPLATCDGRGAKRLRCAYHGWTYELDGRLRAAPEMSKAKNFDRDAQSLIPVQLKIWEGFVFVRLNDGAAALDQLLAGVRERISPIDLSQMTFARREIYAVNANWKVYIDNYLEGYHVPLVHPDLNKIVDYAGYTTELNDWHSVQTSSLDNSADVYGDGEVFYYFIYPNMMLNIVDGRVQTNRVIPDGPGRCLVEFDYYYGADKAAQARAEADQEFSDQVQEEDRLICEAVQARLTSGAYTAGRLCPDREGALWHFHNLLRKDYALAFEGKS